MKLPNGDWVLATLPPVGDPSRIGVRETRSRTAARTCTSSPSATRPSPTGVQVSFLAPASRTASLACSSATSTSSKVSRAGRGGERESFEVVGDEVGDIAGPFDPAADDEGAGAAGDYRVFLPVG